MSSERYGPLIRQLQGALANAAIEANFAGAWSTAAPTSLVPGAAFTVASGGTWRFSWWASGYATAVGAQSVACYIDLGLVDTLTWFFNVINEHAQMGRRTFRASLTAGTHYIYFRALTGLSSDANDTGGFEALRVM